MAIIGIQIDRQNPAYTKADFVFWMPQFKKYVNYYTGRIAVNGVLQQASIYSDNLSELTIGTKIVVLSTSDEITYIGTMTVGAVGSEITYTVTLLATSMQLTIAEGQTSSVCTLKSDGEETFNQLYAIANRKIFKSIYGSDWMYAMSLCIAHYLTLIANQMQTPSGNSLESIAGGGTTKGVLASATIGGFSKSYDIDKTMSNVEEAKFWNQTSYGTSLWALLKTKPIPSIMVVTSGPIPGAN